VNELIIGFGLAKTTVAEALPETVVCAVTVAVPAVVPLKFTTATPLALVDEVAADSVLRFVAQFTVAPGTGFPFASLTVADNVLGVPSDATDAGLATMLTTRAEVASA
jgi:hypothetical protein